MSESKTIDSINFVPYGIIDINDPNFDKRLFSLTKEYGIVVIKNVMTSEECDDIMDGLVSELETISDFKRKSISSTWKKEMLPQQVRAGMFHELSCNTPSVNRARYDPNVIKIFKAYYKNKKGIEYEDLDMIVSNDGLNLKPGSIGPFQNGNIDWAHLDQTNHVDDIYKCIQGQMVLTNSSAGFRASPKSHLVFQDIINHEISNASLDSFFKFKPEQILYFKKMVLEAGGQWQIPIKASKGDFIIWTSSTVHSALLQQKKECPTKKDKWFGWRGVIYICWRPRDEFEENELVKKWKAFQNNLVTCHWGIKVFPSGFGRWTNANLYSKKLHNYIRNPKLIYSIKGMDWQDYLSEKEQIMMGKQKE